MQINEAMFAGTPGFVLKPTGDATGLGRKFKLAVHIIGASSVLQPAGETGSQWPLFVRVDLLHAKTPQKWHTKTAHAHFDPATHRADPVWNESVEWSFAEDELAFVRVLVMRDELLEDEHLGCFAVRVAYMQSGLRLAKLLDKRGIDTGASVLLQVNVTTQG